MRADINQSLLTGEVDVITSKSYYIRALLLAAASENSVKIYGKNDCDDVKAAISAITTLGAKVKKTRYGYNVVPVSNWPKEVEVSVGESATLLRLLVPLLAAKGINSRINAEGSLVHRPVQSLIKPLSDHGVLFTRKNFPLKFSGQLTAGRYVITDTTTSGVLSGLIMALPLLDNESKIIADINSFNKGYIAITMSAVSDFGASILSIENGLSVKGNITYHADEFTVEKDWSNAAVWLSAGVISGNISVKGLNITSAQYDKKIVEYLTEMGAKISITNDCVTAQKSQLNPIVLDMKKNLDIVPCLAICCAAADGVSELKNIERLALKESNRIAEIIKLLSTLSVKTEYKDGNLTIFGGHMATNGGYRAPKDHRIVMAAAIAGSVTGLKIDGIEAVNKSYPAFFEDFMKVRGDATICQ